MPTKTYSFADNTDYKNAAVGLSETRLLQIIRRMSNIKNWGNLYAYYITDSNGVTYEITTSSTGKPNGFTER